jgi:DNA primase
MEIPRLHPDTIAEVKEKVDILDVISDYVVLRKRGKSHLGLCPFHSEKTPSFSVSTEKQFYHCFGCGAGGNAFTFLMELEKHSFTDVVLELAQRYHLPVKTLQPEQRQELERQISLKEQLREILAVASNFYQHALLEKEGQIALEYLKTARGLTDTTIQKFQLGYAPSGWETLYRYLVDVKRYPVGLVATAGLIQQRESQETSYYDRFRHRLMIPILDVQGRVIAFGSRTLTNEEPKYLNSPETPLFNKSQTVFALHQAYRHISNQDQVIIVEGYFDAIALHQAGINHVVACLGTALTHLHLKKVLRYTPSKRVILNFDTDSAGTKATERIIEAIAPLIYSGQVQLRVLHLPGGKDAAEYLQGDETATTNYIQAVENAPLWLDWQLEQMLQDCDLNQGDQFQQAAGKIVKILNQISNFDLQAHYLGYCAELLSQGNPQLVRLYAEKLQIQIKKPQLGQKLDLPSSSEQGMLEEAESTLLRIYLHHPEYRLLISDSLASRELLFMLNPHRQFWLKIVDLEQNATPPEYLFSILQDDYLQAKDTPTAIIKLFTIDEKTLWEDECRAPQVIQGAIASLEQVSLIKQRSYFLAKWQKLDPLIPTEETSSLYKNLQLVSQQLQALNKIRSSIDG